MPYYLRLCLLLSFLLLGACTSVASSTLVYIVAKQSEISAKNNKRYSAAHRCIIKGQPSPYAIAENIAHGAAITHKYHNVLNNYQEAASDAPLPPHQVAYAFYTIAHRIGDIRAKHRMTWLSPYVTDIEPQALEEKVEQRYFDSYLKKCFYVPPRYRAIVDPRAGFIQPQKPSTPPPHQ